MNGLFCSQRLSHKDDQTPNEGPRTPFERDFDRILFSAPVRRLADKTQVFPLEKNDSVRTRLTHSHEVSNLCRSLATQVCRVDAEYFGANGADAIVIAAAVGLAHDLGNPPFGHQGEEAIRRWFTEREAHLLPKEIKLTPAQRADFFKWEGNAQAFRLLSRLQLTKGAYGLDLTVATLASLMKYTVQSDKVRKPAHPSFKKFGFFQDDKQNAERVLNSVGLSPGGRHPIAYLMEVCDDIAYSVIDIEDAIKKGLVSINDVLACIKRDAPNENWLIGRLDEKIDELRGQDRTPVEINDIGAQYYRTFAIDRMMSASSDAMIANKAQVRAGAFESDLMKSSDAGTLCQALKDFANEHAYQASAVKEVELRGDKLINDLSDYFWRAILECSLGKNAPKTIVDALKPPRPTPFGEFVFSHISSNYVRCFRERLDARSMPADVRYRQLLLLTDMVSGMTENFALDLRAKFERLDDGKSCFD